MNVDFIRTFYRFNRWANLRILDKAALLTENEYRAETNPSFGSVHDTLVHIMSVQWVWLNRWRGISLTGFDDPASYPTISSLRLRWDEINHETQEFVLRQTEESLAEKLTYTNFRREKHGYPLWQMMVHQVNHATQHRSEIALTLTQCHQSPGGMDFLVFVDSEGKTI
ncbi:DinB family protein [Leptolinea tardivitalis]|uniref:DinB family protein n=1 Tax=Leptolinea tardivitalis TaxID=229920 RepID=UPI0007838055|nr:DinB family protein [Leptolinea tardivitalis]GAP21474.1 uncharacterized protein conserved in bacteria [Leptolinea tardivitalis]